jgi:hypothetical protein
MHKAVVVSGTMFWGIFGAIGIIAATLSPMLFDGPAAAQNVSTYVLALGIASFPVTCATSMILSWCALCDGSLLKAYLWLLLPVFSLLMVAGAQPW